MGRETRCIVCLDYFWHTENHENFVMKFLYDLFSVSSCRGHGYYVPCMKIYATQNKSFSVRQWQGAKVIDRNFVERDWNVFLHCPTGMFFILVRFMCQTCMAGRHKSKYVFVHAFPNVDSSYSLESAGSSCMGHYFIIKSVQHALN